MPPLKRRTFLQLLAAALPPSLFARTLQTPVAAFAPSTTISPIPAGGDRYGVKRSLPNGTTAFKVSSKDCRGDFFAMEHHHTKKGGPPLHLHTVEDEWFYVLDGEYIVKVGDQLHHLKAGDSVLGPRNVPHAFAFVGQSSGRFLITYAPAGRMEEFFDGQDRTGGRTYDLQERMAAFGMKYLGPPLQVT
jgi:mannose-6-phosphate isomerase-like protein (cupin superfamily)